MAPGGQSGGTAVGRTNRARLVPGARIAAVTDAVPEVWQAASRELDGAPAYDNHAALLDDPAVHGVVIAAPTAMHREIAVAAARAGKHIICEKPMAMNPGSLQAGTTVICTREKELRQPAVVSWTHLYRDAFLAEDMEFATAIREGRSASVTGHHGLAAAAEALVADGDPVHYEVVETPRPA